MSPAGPRRRDYLAPPAVPRLSHFLGDTAYTLEYSQNLQASLQSIQCAMEHTQITGREANAKSCITMNTHTHTHAHTHTHTHTAASAARIPNVRSSTTERSKWYIKCSHATTNLIHYRLASILMITGGSSPESQLTGTHPAILPR